MMATARGTLRLGGRAVVLVTAGAAAGLVVNAVHPILTVAALGLLKLEAARFSFRS